MLMSATDSTSRPARVMTMSGSHTLDSNWVNVYLGVWSMKWGRGGGGGVKATFKTAREFITHVLLTKL